MKKILTLALLTFSTVIYAEEAPTVKIKGFYLGAGLGSFNYKTDGDWDDENRYGKLVEQTKGNTFKVYTGYQYNKVIAIEATYTNYGETEGYVYTLFADKKTSVKQSPISFSVAANAGFTFDNGIRPFALVGLGYTRLNSSNEFLLIDNIITIKYGVGVEYAPAMLNGLQLRVAYEADSYFSEAYSYKGWGQNEEKEGTDVDIFTMNSFYAGISYKF